VSTVTPCQGALQHDERANFQAFAPPWGWNVKLGVHNPRWLGATSDAHHGALAATLLH
jgi:hypothetical protein